MCDKLKTWYQAASMVNKINMLTFLIPTSNQSDKDLEDNIAELETHFDKLAVMSLPGMGEMHVAILLVSVTNDESLKTTVAALKGLDGDKAT